MTELQKTILIIGGLIIILFIIMVIWSLIVAYLELKIEKQKQENEVKKIDK